VGTGTRPDYLSDRAEQKNEGPKFNEETGKSRNSCRVSGGDVGAEEMVTKSANIHCPETNNKCSKIVFAVTYVALRVLQCVAVFCSVIQHVAACSSHICCAQLRAF